MYTPSDFVSGHRHPPGVVHDALWFIVDDGKLLVTAGETPGLPEAQAALAFADPAQAQYFGTWRGRDCLALNVAHDTQAPPGHLWTGLRGLFPVFPEALLALAGRAMQIAEWDRSHRYCGRCGSATAQKETERVKICSSCGHAAYPRLSPAMMVLVHREREILLARAAHFAQSMYSALAGFVEPGESLEDTVHREVHEEVGLTVRNLRYFASQSWPFPHQLMIAFHADYAAGEIKPDQVEIIDAQWFTPENLPKLPSQVSIARRLIEQALQELRAA